MSTSKILKLIAIANDFKNTIFYITYINNQCKSDDFCQLTWEIWQLRNQIKLFNNWEIKLIFKI